MKQLYKYLLVTSFLFSVAATTFGIFLPVYFDDLGLSYFEIGLAMAMLSVPAALMCLYVGYLEENLDKIKLLVASHFTYALLPVFYFLSSNFLSVIVVRLYDGFASSLKFVPTYTLLESKKAYKTGVNISLNESAMYLGGLIGPLIAGMLILQFDIKIIFVMAFVVLVPMALISLRMLKYSKISFNHKASFKDLMNREFRNKSFMVLSFVYLLFVTISSSRFLAVPLYMKASGFNEFFIAIVGSSMFFFTFLFEMFSGRLETDKLRNKLLTVGILLSAVSISLFPVVPLDLYYFIALALLFSAGVALVRPAVFSDVVMLDNSHSNVATGIIFFFGYLGAMIGNFLGGILLEISFSSFFFSAGVILVSSAVGSIYLRTLVKQK